MEGHSRVGDELATVQVGQHLKATGNGISLVRGKFFRPGSKALDLFVLIGDYAGFRLRPEETGLIMFHHDLPS